MGKVLFSTGKESIWQVGSLSMALIPVEKIITLISSVTVLPSTVLLLNEYGSLLLRVALSLLPNTLYSARLPRYYLTRSAAIASTLWLVCYTRYFLLTLGVLFPKWESLDITEIH